MSYLRLVKDLLWVMWPSAAVALGHHYNQWWLIYIGLAYLLFVSGLSLSVSVVLHYSRKSLENKLIQIRKDKFIRRGISYFVPTLVFSAFILFHYGHFLVASVYASSAILLWHESYLIRKITHRVKNATT